MPLPVRPRKEQDPGSAAPPPPVPRPPQRGPLRTLLGAAGSTLVTPAEVAVSAGESALEGGVSFTAGTAKGLIKDPLIRFAFDFAFGEETTDEVLNSISAEVGDSTLGKIGEIAGKWGPLIYGTTIALRGGVALGVGAAGAIGKTGALGKGAKNIAARQTTAPLKMLDDLTKFRKGRVERVSEALGRSAGIGVHQGVLTAAEGGTLSDVERSAKTGFVLGLGFEAVLGVAGAALGAAKVKAEEIVLDKAVTPILTGLKKDIASQNSKFANETRSIMRTNNAKQQEVDLQTKKFGHLMETLSGKPVLFPELGRPLKEVQGLMAQAQKMAKAELALTKFLGGKKRQFIQEKVPAFAKKKLKSQNAAQILQKNLDEPGMYMSTRERVFNPNGLRLTLAELGQKFATTPEGLGGKLGGVAAKMMIKPLTEANQNIIVKQAIADGRLMRLYDKTLVNVGISHKQANKDPKILLGLEDAWEKGSVQGVRDFMLAAGRSDAEAASQVAIYEETKLGLELIGRGIAQMGGQPLMTRRHLQDFKVAEYTPHHMILNEAKMHEILVERHGQEIANQMIVEFKKNGLSKLASFDWNRIKSGSLLDKVNDKSIGRFYEANPWIARQNYMHEGIYRLEMGKRFGLDGELIDPIIEAIGRDAGKGAQTLAANIFGQVNGRMFVEDNLRHLVSTATSYQVMTKLGMGVYANFPQTASVLAFTGFKNSVKTLNARIRGTDTHHIKQSVGLMDETNVVLQESMGMIGGKVQLGISSREATTAGLMATRMGRMARRVLITSGFNWTEANNRVLAGYGAKFVVRDDLRRMVSGDLRGRNFDASMRRFNSLGIAPDEVRLLARGIEKEGPAFLDSGIGRELESRAIYRGAQITQFTPGSMRLPEYWTHPTLRAVAQFKSFALNQGRFMKDQVLAEAAAGNLAPMAYVLSVYPVAGEFVGNVKSLVTGKKRETSGFVRGLENLTHMGGAGILQSILQSTNWRGGVLGTVAGPTASSWEAVLEGIFSPAALARDMGNDPTIQNAKFAVRLLGAGAFKALSAASESDVSRTAQELIQDFRSQNAVEPDRDQR